MFANFLGSLDFVFFLWHWDVKKKWIFFAWWCKLLYSVNLCVVTSEAGQGCGWGRGERRGGATAGSWHRQPIKTLDSIQSANQSAGFIAPVTDSQSAPWILINQPIRAQDSLLLTQTAKQSIITLLFVSNNYNIWYGENVWFGLVRF